MAIGLIVAARHRRGQLHRRRGLHRIRRILAPVYKHASFPWPAPPPPPAIPPSWPQDDGYLPPRIPICTPVVAQVPSGRKSRTVSDRVAPLQHPDHVLRRPLHRWPTDPGLREGPELG
jgi:hypothetical protein